MRRTWWVWPMLSVLVVGCPSRVRDDEGIPARRRLADDPKETEARESVVSGNTEFALSVHTRLCAEPGNVVWSPLSVSTALSMAATGAGGPTAVEMRTVLRGPGDRESADRGFASLLHELADARTGPVALLLANSLWRQSNHPWNAAYSDRLRDFYGAGIHETDFADPRSAADAVNRWVADRTRNRITRAFDAGAFPRDTRLVPISAAYFKGDWASQFPAGETRVEDFRTPAGTVRVAMMHQTGEFAYSVSDDGRLRLLELPYVGGRFSMVLVIEREPSGALDAPWDAGKLKLWLGRAGKQKVALSLPKFRVRSEFPLRDVLTKLGMATAFGPQADFRAISPALEPLFIGEVRHSAMVEVDETGTTAAAATGVSIGCSAQSPPMEYRVDRPFAFLIRDRTTGSVLFLGRVRDPSVVGG